MLKYEKAPKNTSVTNILYQCNKNYDMLKSRVMAWDKQIILGHFYPLPPKEILKIKICKNKKNTLNQINFGLFTPPSAMVNL